MMDIYNQDELKALAIKIDKVLNGELTGHERRYGFALVLLKGVQLADVSKFSYISSFTTPDSQRIGQALVDRARDKLPSNEIQKHNRS